MSTPNQHQSNRRSDEIGSPTAGGEAGKNPGVNDSQATDLSSATLPPAPRYLDETGESLASEFRGWQGTWIEDA
jgi:hypothetical protein